VQDAREQERKGEEKEKKETDRWAVEVDGFIAPLQAAGAVESVIYAYA